jgi:hypothetical protein
MKSESKTETYSKIIDKTVRISEISKKDLLKAFLETEKKLKEKNFSFTPRAFDTFKKTF